MSICSAGRSSSSRNYLLLSHSVSIFGCGGASEWSACDVRVLCEWCERSYCSPRRCNHCVSSDSIKLPGRRRRCVGARRNKQMVYTVQWLAKPNVFQDFVQLRVCGRAWKSDYNEDGSATHSSAHKIPRQQTCHVHVCIAGLSHIRLVSPTLRVVVPCWKGNYQIHSATHNFLYFKDDERRSDERNSSFLKRSWTPHKHQLHHRLFIILQWTHIMPNEWRMVSFTFKFEDQKLWV